MALAGRDHITRAFKQDSSGGLILNQKEVRVKLEKDIVSRASL
jgi:hypothetical protein